VSSNQPLVQRRPRTRSVVSWVLYDLANTVFSMGVVSMFFPLWVREGIGADRADTTVGVTTAISMTVILLLSPVIGSMTDRAKRRLPFLTASTLCCVGATLMMGRVGWFGTLAAFVVANAFYQGGQQFYDALLPSVSTPETRGRIGGIGVGVGYVGSYLAILLSFIGKALGWPSAAQFFWVGALFLIFSVPCFLWVEEAENPRIGRVWSLSETRLALVRTIATLRSVNECPGLLRFLIGRLFYTDPINTVIAIMMLYSLNVTQSGGIDLARAKSIANLVMLGAITFAIVGAVLAGKLVDRFGARRVLSSVLGLWSITFLLAASLGLFGLPWQLLLLVSALAGMSLGSTWTADRPLMLELTPPERLGEFYGLYGMVGRFAAVVGPLLWAICFALGKAVGWSALRAQGAGCLVLLGLIWIAAIILRPITQASRPSVAQPLEGA
jgi:MFS transporter, UMF1 family